MCLWSRGGSIRTKGPSVLSTFTPSPSPHKTFEGLAWREAEGIAFRDILLHIFFEKEMLLTSQADPYNGSAQDP